MLIEVSRTLIARFYQDCPGGYYAAVKASVDHCLDWIGCTDSEQYGIFKHGGIVYRAIRVSYAINKHDSLIFDTPLLVSHDCNRPICVNPKHLLLDDDAGNHKHRNECDRQAKGVDNGRAKLDEESVIAILVANWRGEMHTKLALQYGITTRVIRDIVSRKTWRHVKFKPY